MAHSCCRGRFCFQRSKNRPSRWFLRYCVILIAFWWINKRRMNVFFIREDSISTFSQGNLSLLSGVRIDENKHQWSFYFTWNRVKCWSRVRDILCICENQVCREKEKKKRDESLDCQYLMLFVCRSSLMKCAFVRSRRHWMNTSGIIARAVFTSATRAALRWPAAVVVVVENLIMTVSDGTWTKVRWACGWSSLIVIHVIRWSFFTRRDGTSFFFLDDTDFTADPTKFRNDFLLHQVKAHGQNSHSKQNIDSSENEFRRGIWIVLTLSRHLGKNERFR